MKFTVTYEVVTADSAERGDVADSGVLVANSTLRDAVSAFDARTRQCGSNSLCWSDSDFTTARWLTRTYSEYAGDEYSVSIHFPDNLSPSSRLRLINLLEGV